mmetsp:Transcript_3684/g.11120  ORF Transcript_3684/g.11120 Transcript_3684/m.11120 type:complete len:631 (+) Transcript_3684:36-1928(+)
MKFKEVLEKHRTPRRHIDYGLLKQRIRSGVSRKRFEQLLADEVRAVDGELQAMQASASSLNVREVHSFAVLNYLALRKIEKKADKWLAGSSSGSLVSQSRLCMLLLNASLPVELARAQRGEEVGCSASTGGGCEENCPVCLDAYATDHIVLTQCGHRFCYSCMAECALAGFESCPVCRKPQSLDPTLAAIDKLLGTHAGGKYDPLAAPLPTAAEEAAAAKRLEAEGGSAAGSGGGGGGELRVLTWNLAAICFPFKAPSWQIALGVLLGLDWADSCGDVALDAQSSRAKARWAQQAAYIRSSSADLVLLQEVSGKATLRALLGALPDYEAAYVPWRPTYFAVQLFALAVLLVASAKLLLLEAFCAAAALPLPLPAHPLARLVLIAAVCATRWRHSAVTQYLLGSIAGQLVVLRRRGSPASAFVHTAFDAFVDACSAETSSPLKQPVGAASPAVKLPAWQSWLLGQFFRLRPRGVQEVVVALAQGDVPACRLTLLNTHLPHLSSNSTLVRYLARRIHAAAAATSCIFSGDLNPDKGKPLRSQFGAIFQCGATLGEETGALVTWDTANPLIRGKKCNPDADMQLDFCFLHQPNEPRPLLSRMRSSLLRREAFFLPGAPLSDHIGILTTFELRE